MCALIASIYWSECNSSEKRSWAKRLLQGRSPSSSAQILFPEANSTLLERRPECPRGFLLKDVSLADLTRAIHDVAAGGTLMRPVITARILRAATQVTTDFDAIDRPERLSRREIETLRLMAGGHSNRDIADAFGTTEGTVKNHVSSILSKLGAKSRTQAVLKGMELGYLGAASGTKQTKPRS